MDAAELSMNLVGSNLTNSTNSTLGDEAALLALCALYRDTPWVYLVAAPVWLVFLAYWLFLLHKHADCALDLHRLLLWVPFIEVLHCTASIFHFWLCPWRTLLEQLLGAAWIVLSILKEPVMLVCLLLVAKGWGITRPRLSLGELGVSSVIVVLLYTSIVLQFALAHWARLVPMLACWLMMLLNVLLSILGVW